MNIGTPKGDIWSNYFILGTGIDADERTECECGIGLDRCQLALKRRNLRLLCGNNCLQSCHLRLQRFNVIMRSSPCLLRPPDVGAKTRKTAVVKD